MVWLKKTSFINSGSRKMCTKPTSGGGGLFTSPVADQFPPLLLLLVATLQTSLLYILYCNSAQTEIKICPACCGSPFLNPFLSETSCLRDYLLLNQHKRCRRSILGTIFSALSRFESHELDKQPLPKILLQLRRCKLQSILGL